MDPVRINLKDVASTLWISHRNDSWEIVIQGGLRFSMPIPLDLPILYCLENRSAIAGHFQGESNRIDFLWHNDELVAIYRDQQAIYENIVDLDSFADAMSEVARAELILGLIDLRNKDGDGDGDLSETVQALFEVSIIAEAILPLPLDEAMAKFEELRPTLSPFWQRIPIHVLRNLIDPQGED